MREVLWPNSTYNLLHLFRCAIDNPYPRQELKEIDRAVNLPPNKRARYEKPRLFRTQDRATRITACIAADQT